MGRIPEGSLEEGGYKSPKIKHLWPHHISMARMFAAGCQPEDIARATGFSAGQVSRILGSPAFQAELNRLMEAIDDAEVRSVRAELIEMSKRAVEVLDEDLNMEVPTLDARRIRQSAAFDVLNRTGYKDKMAGLRDLHLHKDTHIHQNPKDMTNEELQDDVFDLIKAEDDD